ncbi:hypothetical protein D3C72_2196530 [compost metagenome]
MGSSSACMPMKCMAQMPVPMTSEPAAHQARPMPRCEVRTRRAMSKPTYDANTAMAREPATSSRL